MQSQISKNSQRTKRLAISSMFACLALIFSYVEAIIPFNAGIPGVKLGIANLVVIIALYEMNFRYAFAINALRILISGLLFSGVSEPSTLWREDFSVFASCGCSRRPICSA